MERSEKFSFLVVDSLKHTTQRAITSLGGPTSLTSETARKVLEAISQGHSYRVASMRAGINTTSLTLWLRKGKEGEAPVYEEFYENFQLALAMAEETRLGTVLDAADGKGDFEGKPVWQASAWWLERRYPEMYGRRSTRVGVSAKGDTVHVTLNVGDPPPGVEDDDGDPIEIPAEILEDDE